MVVINIIELNENNFKEFIKEGISFVCVKADWCIPCKTLEPIIEQTTIDLANEGINVKIGKLNTDKNTEVVNQLGVRNIPSVFIYKNGEQVDKFVGVKPKNQIIEMIKSHINE